ncbi:MAG: CinA family protein [Phycisphaerales bacterium]
MASERLAECLRARALTLTTIESCTGGMLGASITAIPGSSSLYPGGLVTYSNRLKHELAGVSNETLSVHGAVSPQTAVEMAHGGRARIGADYAISITGVAGPDGGSDEKPVGTVWICIAGPDESIDCRRFQFPGDRENVRTWSCIHAIEMAIQAIMGDKEMLAHEAEQFGA